MKFTTKLPLIFLAIGLCGCITTKSQVKPYVQTKQSNIDEGIIFTLPKSLIKLDITYSLYTKKTWEANADGTAKKTDSQGQPIAPKSEAAVVLIDTPIHVSTVEIPDEDMRFLFSTSSMDSAFKEKNYTLTLTKEGLLKSFNSDITDKTTEFIGNITGITLNLAKLAAVAGVDVVELVKEKDITVSRIIDIDKLIFNTDENTNVATYNDLERIEKMNSDYSWPEVTVEFSASKQVLGLIQMKSSELTTVKTSADSKPNKTGIRSANMTGIPYRSEGVISVQIKVDGVAVLDTPMSITHAGPIAFIPIESDAFESATHKIEFHDNSSQILSFQSKGSAKAVALSGAIHEASTEILSSAKELNTLKLDTEISKLKKQKELLDAKKNIEGTEISKVEDQINLLKKQKELINEQDIDAHKKVMELQLQINSLTKEKQLADLQKTVTGTEVTSLQEQINLLTKQKELVAAQKSLNDFDNGSTAYKLEHLDQQKQLLDKQTALKQSEISDMSTEIQKLKKELELIKARKDVSANSVK